MLSFTGTREDASHMVGSQRDNDFKECLPVEPLLNERQYSKITDQSLTKVQRDRKHGRGCPFVKLGRHVRYRPEDVRRYFESNLQVARG